MSNFNVSDKVVCVDARIYADHKYILPDGPLESDKVYVICGFYTGDPSKLGLIIVGLRCLYKDGVEVGFNSIRFRKLDEIKSENAIKKTQHVSKANVVKGERNENLTQ